LIKFMPQPHSMPSHIADLRREYSQATLDVATVNVNPIVQFETWFNEAINAGITEPNAMNLATVNEQGKPSSRIVLLKGVENGKFLFYSNYQSKKGKELESNSACALTFFWPDLERQIRIEGVAERVDEKTSEQYFQSRPRSSQVGAWASPQSAPIKDRSLLDERVLQMEKKFEGFHVLPKPHQWGGYQVEPFLMEFWQGRPGRLHDRIQYSRVDNLWKIFRLAP
jgi:pyridoxamine 5'-phosphate oxidase